MTSLEMLEYIGERYASMADIAHISKVSCTTLYRILNHEGGYSKRVQAKLRKVFDGLVEDERQVYESLSWPGR